MKAASAPPEFNFAFRPGWRARSLTGLGGFGGIFLVIAGYAAASRVDQGLPLADVLPLVIGCGLFGGVVAGAALYAYVMLGRSTRDSDVWAARAHLAFYVGASLVWAGAAALVILGRPTGPSQAAVGAAFASAMALASLWGAWLWGRWLGTFPP